MSKLATLMLITALVLSGLVIVGSAFAKSISKPSVPEFTVELVDSAYDVPTTYEVDPYTGENMTQDGYHLVSTSIQVKIKNQPFTPYEIQDLDGHNWTVNFFYNIRIKGRFTEGWIELYNPSDGHVRQDSESEYTVRAYSLGENTDTVLGTKMIRLPDEGLIDFQVEAMIGYVDREIIIPVPGTGWIFVGETSGWSTTQTLTIGENQSPASPTTKYQPSEVEVIIAVAIIVAVFGLGLGLLIHLLRKQF